MNKNQRIDRIYQELFSVPKTKTYAVLDGASIKDLLLYLDEYEPDCVCLYTGELPHDVEEAAPYLVHLEKESPFTRWVIENGWGNHWGIFALCPENIKAVRKHFRSLVRVKDPDGKRLFFRFYDPRVLNIYLPTCNEEEVAAVFGPVVCFITEEDPNRLLRFNPNVSDGIISYETIEIG